MRLFVLAACVAACGRSPDRVRSQTSPLVVLEGDGAFGNQAVTTMSAPRTFVVRPAPPSDSLQRDRIESIESTCPEFVVDTAGAGLIVERVCVAFGGGSYGGGGETECIAYEEHPVQFRVVFRPVVELPSSDQCRIIVRLDGGASRSIPVSGTGIPPPFAVDISPSTTIDFFTVNTNTTSQPARTYTVKNKGSQPLTVSTSASLANGVFAISGNLAQHQIQPGISETFGVTCTPNALDVFSGSITITTNVPSQLTIPLVCKGIDHPITTIDDVEATVLVGRSKTIQVQLKNQSVTDTVTGLAVALAPPGMPGLAITSPPPTVLAPLAAATVELTWTPPEPYKGALGGLVLSIDGKPDRLIGIAMAHATIADVASDMPEGDKLDFGRMCIGDTKKRSFKMQPGGTDTNLFSDYTVLGAASETPFSAQVIAPDVVQVASPTAVEIEVSTMPMISDGTFDGTVTVSTDSPTEQTFPVPVTVQVLQGGTTVNPPLLNFREVVVTGFSDTKTATFTNCTAGDIEITGVALDGDSAADFEIIQIVPDGIERLPPFTLPRGGEIVIAIQMLPQSDGTKEAQVGIDFQEPGKPATSEEIVALLGEGFLNTPGRNSYYSCTAGSPIHLAPLGFVFGFLVLRRRRRR